MKNKKGFGCFVTVFIIAIISAITFVIVVGGKAAVDKAGEKLVEYKDSAYNLIADALSIERIKKDTVKGLTEIGIINDTLPKPAPVRNQVDSSVIKVKLEIHKNMMYIRPKINGVEMRFLLDTGCADIHLTPVEVLFLGHQGLLDSKKPVGTATCIYADGQEHECVEYILKSVELAGIKIDSVKCTSDPEGGSADDSPLFGQAMLGKFGDIMINYSDSTLIIKKKYGK